MAETIYTQGTLYPSAISNLILDILYTGAWVDLITADEFEGVRRSDTLAVHPGWKTSTAFIGDRKQWTATGPAADGIITNDRCLFEFDDYDEIVGAIYTGVPSGDDGILFWLHLGLNWKAQPGEIYQLRWRFTVP